MRLSGIAQKAFLDRYSLKDKKGGPLEKQPQKMWRRVAKAAAFVEEKKKRERWTREFYDAMRDFKYVPGGRILAGAGTGYEVSFYNCFVIPSPQDSRGGILDTLKQMVEIMAHGGGVGINLSSLRPKGARVKKVNGFSSGPCNWAELFSLATKDIIQQGGSRRGALMLMLWDWHPDMEEFITVKQDMSRINGANLSLCVSDKFMEAVKKDGDWPLVFPDTDDPAYDEKWDGDIEVWRSLGKKIKVHKIVKARKIWDLIAEAAWRSAEPGVVFMERYNKLHNNYYWNRINCVNPCGEEGLPPWGVCNLGSINLSAFVKGKGINKKGLFDFALLKKVVHTAVRFQDNVVDMDPYIFDGIRKMQLQGERRIGLGTMGLGDALIKLHIRYGSEESLKFIDKVYKLIRDEAYRASVALSREKGAFPKFDKNLYPKGLFIQELPKDIQKDIKKHGIRNSVLLMQAPTGTTSLIANTTSGIEPVYEFEFVRRSRLGEDIIRHHLYETWYKKHENEVKEGKVTKPDWFVSANDLTPEDHVRVQAAIQKYVDASISKTVNAPNTQTIEEVKKLYTLAYELGSKGITYMREGSRQGVLERQIEKEEKKKELQPPVKPRPMVVRGATYRIATPVGTAFVTVNTDDNGDPLEVFVNIGKAGTDVYSMATALGRMISLIFRFSSHLTPSERVKEVIQKLSGIGGSRSMGFGKDRIRSLPDAVSKVLSMHFGLNGYSEKSAQEMMVNGEEMQDGATDKDQKPKDTPTLVSESVQQSLLQTSSALFDICPSCGEATLAHEEGCKKCYSCGFSEC
ncbi:adenosylcobalamin-dependent ribonucleoside-diphosphate reductase [Candidatus Roizmanbacteria bacterium]|nr:adenosylcobalamin-dependent ribonucleoside-diphosphate reductase [Candidatus Roizmanbacteria bacterium]